jgi:putative DNA primase/helicase
MTLLSTGMYRKNLEKFVINSVVGGNGKGVLNEHVFKAFGQYAYKLLSAVLTQPLKSGCNPEVASMHNKRFVLATEPEDSQNINTSTLKGITGGNSINARMAHSNDTKTDLKLTFVLECNSKPKLDNVNEAVSRRLLEIPFQPRFVDLQTSDDGK